MIYELVIPLLLTFAPWVAVRYVFSTPQSKQFSYRQSIPYLWTAAALWVASVYVPNVPVTDQSNSFSMHFLGGIIAGILFFFVRKAYKVHFSQWWQEPLMLYFFASGLGVLNELFELFLDQSGILVVEVHRNDTWWDLTANTLGAFLAYLLALVYRHLPRGRGRSGH
jgi:VanZ family protein